MASSVQQVQSVAKRLEKMLETALNQLKIEQKLRKESENKLMDIELEFVNKEHQIKSLEEEIINLRNEKDQKILNLESTINFLQSVVVQKEKEVLAMQEKYSGEVEMETMNLGRSVEQYEETLSHLVGNNPQSDSCISDNGNVKNEYDPDEYILDESMEELNEEVSVSEESEPIKPKKEVRHKTKCQICKEVFKNKSQLQSHEKETGHVVLWDCDMCDKKFKTKSIAQMHKARLHSTVMPFKCGKCEKRFKDQGSCRRHEANDSVHIRLESMKLNPNLICNICGKEFDRNRRWCLDQHLLTHLANKKFPCELCGQFYRQKGYLQTHMKSCRGKKIKSDEMVNTDEAEEVSDKESEDNEDNDHEDNPRTCTICNINYRTYRGYMKHGENVHNATSEEHFASIQEIISTNT